MKKNTIIQLVAISCGLLLSGHALALSLYPATFANNGTKKPGFGSWNDCTNQHCFQMKVGSAVPPGYKLATCALLISTSGSKGKPCYKALYNSRASSGGGWWNKNTAFNVPDNGNCTGNLAVGSIAICWYYASTGITIEASTPADSSSTSLYNAITTVPMTKGDKKNAIITLNYVALTKELSATEVSS